MERVGLRELRKSIWDYVRRVRRGEARSVTERGEPGVDVRALSHPDDPLARLEARGLVVRRGRGNLADLPPPAELEHQMALPETLETLGEDRL